MIPLLIIPVSCGIVCRWGKIRWGAERLAGLSWLSVAGFYAKSSSNPKLYIHIPHIHKLSLASFWIWISISLSIILRLLTTGCACWFILLGHCGQVHRCLHSPASHNVADTLQILIFWCHEGGTFSFNPPDWSYQYIWVPVIQPPGKKCWQKETDARNGKEGEGRKWGE